MEYMLLFTGPKGAPAPEPEGFAAMGRYAQQLASQGKLRRGAPLASESDAVSVRVRDGKAFVTDGPFAESKEVVGGFWIIEAASREEAIEIARRCPHLCDGNVVEVHRLQRRLSYGDSEAGKPFLFVFRMEPGLSDPDGTKLREMIAFGEGLERGTLVETAPLANDPPPARIESGGGRILVTDGPFAESKEAVGGYGLLRLESRAEAIELAKRYPHARWGPVEVREILFFDRV